MKTISSAEFRKTYPRLPAPVRVTANGHLIGEWTPMYVVAEEMERPTSVADFGISIHTPKERQAERDAILRKINRGG